MDNKHETKNLKLVRNQPWNKGKLIGAKPPLRPSHVWSIRTKLQMADRKRDLALFNLAIDSKLRGCDVVALRVDDVAPSGYAMDRATIRRRRRVGRYGLRSRIRLAWRSMTTSGSPDESLDNSCSPAGAMAIVRTGSRHGSTRVSCTNGSPASDLIRPSSAPTHYGARRRC